MIKNGRLLRRLHAYWRRLLHWTAPAAPLGRRGAPIIKLALLTYAALTATAAPAASPTPATPPAAAASLTAIAAASDALDAWQLDTALAAAEAQLYAQPDLPAAQLLAAEVLHQRGDHSEAWDLLQAIPVAARDARWAAIAPQVAGSAQYAPHFQSLPTAHFSLRYIDKDVILAHYAAAVLEAAYAQIGADLGYPAVVGPAAKPIVVEIYPDARGLAQATGLTVKEIDTSGTIAVCKFHRLMVTSPLATADGYGWADTLAHEFVHLVISQISHNRVPIWLHEGIAKYFESRWRGPAGTALGAYAEQLLGRAINKNSFITFAQMHPSMAKLPSQEDAALAFAEVFSLIEFLVQGHGSTSIAQLLQALGQGEPLEAALKRLFGQDLPGLERAWHLALKRRPPPAGPPVRPHRIRLALRDDGDGSEPALEDVTDRAVHDASRLGELLRLDGHVQAAVLEFERAQRLGGLRYPTVIGRLADAYQEVGRLDEAERLLAQTLAVHPDDPDAHLKAGRLARRRQNWPAARGHFEAVRLHNPFIPELHAALAEIYDQAKEPQRAAQERDFLALCQTRRPPPEIRDVSAQMLAAADLGGAPAAPQGRLRLLPRHWRPVQLDGGPPRATPQWHLQLAAGAHQLTYLDATGTAQSRPLEIAAGRAQSVFLP